MFDSQVLGVDPGTGSIGLAVVPAGNGPSRASRGRPRCRPLRARNRGAAAPRFTRWSSEPLAEHRPRRSPSSGCCGDGTPAARCRLRGPRASSCWPRRRRRSGLRVRAARGEDGGHRRRERVEGAGASGPGARDRRGPRPAATRRRGRDGRSRSATSSSRRFAGSNVPGRRRDRVSRRDPGREGGRSRGPVRQRRRVRGAGRLEHPGGASAAGEAGRGCSRGCRSARTRWCCSASRRPTSGRCSTTW